VWPVERPTPVPAQAVQVGDMFVTPKSGRPVPVVEAYDFGPLRQIRCVFQHCSRRKGDPVPEYTYSRYPYEDVQVLRQQPCAAPVCEAHMRDVGGPVHCQNHWRSWEEIYVSRG
jgi:hypothetical protein